MYELKRLLKRHIEENLFKYILILALFAMGILAGFVFSANLSYEVSESVNGEVGGFIDGFSEGVFNKGEIFRTSFLKTLRITLLIFAGGLSVWLLPISFATLFSYGFSLGFTLGYLSSNFGAKGLGVGVVSVFLVFLINIPSYIILSVVAINNSRYKRKGRNSESNFGLYSIIFTVLFFFSLIPVVADTFCVPWIIGLICR